MHYNSYLQTMKYWLSFLFCFSLLHSYADSTAFYVQYGNDLFNGTDRYLTQIIELRLQHPQLSRSPLRHVLLTTKKGSDVHGIAIRQEVYTPVSIRRDTVQTLERPYTATLFLSQQRASEIGPFLFVSALQLGVLGPAALGKEEQTAIHRALDNLLPLGWEYQLKNDLILNYNVSGSWSFISSRNFKASLFTDARVGTLFSDISPGLTFRFQTSGSRRTVLLAKAEGLIRLVGYNATLQGGLLNNSNVHTLPSSSLQRAIPQLNAQFGISHGKLGISYVQHYTAPEYIHGLDHGWGELVFSWKW
jgi:hypothetical protein